jgi:hypothetical protein
VNPDKLGVHRQVEQAGTRAAQSERCVIDRPGIRQLLQGPRPPCHQSIKHGLRYQRNWTRRFTWAWLRGLGVYRLSGRVRSGAAHALR